MQDGIYSTAAEPKDIGKGYAVVENGIIRGFDEQYFMRYTRQAGASFGSQPLTLSEKKKENGFTLHGELPGWGTTKITIDGTRICDLPLKDRDSA
jgi:hypothetical protein